MSDFEIDSLDFLHFASPFLGMLQHTSRLTFYSKISDGRYIITLSVTANIELTDNRAITDQIIMLVNESAWSLTCNANSVS